MKEINEQEIIERVNQRRRQILVHSFLYYQLNLNKISDYQYDAFTRSLIELQAEYPEIAEKCIFADEFRGFQAGWSYQLPYAHPDVQRWAFRFLRSCDAIEKQEKIKDKPKEV